MKFFVALALLAMVAVSFAQPVEQGSPAGAEEPKETAATPAQAEAKDLDTANSYVYGYGYPAYYGGYGYGGYGGGYLGYGGYGYGYPAYYGGYYY